MYLSTDLLAAAAAALLLLPSTLAQATFQRSSKRGLVYVASAKYPADNQIWVESGSDLTWYYNYELTPSADYNNRSQTEFEFVPMLWGAPATTTDTAFLDGVKSMIKGGRNISHVLTFNEPDGTSSTGGSSIDPALAATTWIREIEPLRELGLKVGAPAVTGSPSGFTWLSNFFAACASQGTNCTVDFIPIHWYGNFDGLASHIGQVTGTWVPLSFPLPSLSFPRPLSNVDICRYPNTTIWVTEYALNDASLSDTQRFFNTSAEYFDRLDYIERYSYFGSFRSSVSNVGPNAAMLDQKGRLTDIGSWYLGGAATNNVPSSSDAGRPVVNSLWAATVFALVAFFMY